MRYRGILMLLFIASTANAQSGAFWKEVARRKIPLTVASASANLIMSFSSTNYTESGGLLTVWPDLSGNAYNGTASNTIWRPTIVSNAFGAKQGLWMDGTNDWVRFPPSAVRAITGGSLSVFYMASKTKSGARNVGPYAFIIPAGGNRFMLDVQADNTMRFRSQWTNAQPIAACTSAASYATFSAKVLSGRVSATAKNIVLFDGTNAIASNTTSMTAWSGAAFPDVGDNPIRISNSDFDTAGATETWGGYVGEFRVYNNLSMSEHIAIAQELLTVWGL